MSLDDEIRRVAAEKRRQRDREIQEREYSARKQKAEDDELIDAVRYAVAKLAGLLANSPHQPPWSIASGEGDFGYREQSVYFGLDANGSIERRSVIDEVDYDSWRRGPFQIPGDGEALDHHIRVHLKVILEGIPSAVAHYDLDW